MWLLLAIDDQSADWSPDRAVQNTVINQIKMKRRRNNNTYGYNSWNTWIRAVVRVRCVWQHVCRAYKSTKQHWLYRRRKNSRNDLQNCKYEESLSYISSFLEETRIIWMQRKPKRKQPNVWFVRRRDRFCLYSTNNGNRCRTMTAKLSMSA